MNLSMNSSLAAEGGGPFTGSVSAGAIPPEQEDEEDENEELILPEMTGKLDPTILASLPPSMQLDLLVQMRERLMAENRQKYQKVKKAPSKFSELQIQAYLKTVAFRREIDQVQKSAAGRGIGGVKSSRIASEANREFIFSSSFTGDKQMLTAAGSGKHGQDYTASLDSSTPVSSTVQFHTFTGPAAADSTPEIGQDIGTYIDERGRVRVSRVRGLGIRVTRDLQRNLDMMREFEQDKVKDGTCTDGEAILKSLSDNNYSLSTSIVNEVNDEFDSSTGNMDTQIQMEEESHSEVHIDNPESAIEISFVEESFVKDGDGTGGTDEDDIFATLVAGSSTLKVPSNVEEGNVSDEEEVDWEEGVCDVPSNTGPLFTEQEHISRGHLEEEADIQEAIRRSLQDFTKEKSSSEIVDLEISGGILETSVDALSLEDSMLDSSSVPLKGVYHQHRHKSHEAENGVERLCVEAMQLMDNPLDICEKSAISKGNLNDGVSVDLYKGSSTHEVGDDGRQRHEEAPTEDGSTALELKQPDMNLVECRIDDSNLGETNDSEVGASDTAPTVHNSISDSSHQNLSSGIINSRDSIGDDNLTRDTFHSDIVSEIDEVSKSGHQFNEDKPPLPYDLQFEIEGSLEAHLDEEIVHLRQEREVLGDERRKLERNAESVSSEMFTECQELLQMFGLPYIIAPMEAEAQCAYMELANMVDGVVTDDSDVFLFGARSVYKNIFDDRKYVETYFMKDIESELGLSREKLIRMALLLGSDYTEGVSGIGIVNAIEVVNAFPEEEGLQKFKEWIESPDPAILGKLSSNLGGNSKQKSLIGGQGENVTGNRSADNQIKQIFMEKHRNVSKNWHIPSSFPSAAVISAYTSPQVDESTEPFLWGKPDLSVLRKLCWEKFGWNNHKADELLIPVLKEYNKHETQLRLEAFYTFNERFAKIRSQRIKKAVKGITGSQSSDLMMDVLEKENSKRVKKGRVHSSEHENDKSGEPSYGHVDVATPRHEIFAEESSLDQINECEVENQFSGSEKMQQKVPMQKKGQGGRRPNKNARGRGRGGSIERGKRKGQALESSETSSSGDEKQSEAENRKKQSALRRSVRPRNQMKYTEEDLEGDGLHSSPILRDGSHMNERTEQPIEPIALDDDTTMVGDVNGLDESDRNHDSSSFSKEYLFIGGGFCVDEDDPSNNPVPAVTSAVRESEKLGNMGSLASSESRGNSLIENVSGHLSSMNSNDRQPVNTIEQPSPSEDANLIIAEPASGVGLRAMPNLRRKKRKT
ncbi:DNA repair protein UVH3 isoform X2 [Aristolochia californica]|uniref:DNA repair protein UVH3 isoform X2 n=1 Tax=Aristolochia californica TaxID=171875 RepID=UPI0035E37E2C